MRCRQSVIILAAAILSSAPAFAADPSLVDAAKREGEVVWYTTQIVPQLVAPISAAFEKKYGIKVSFVRANASDVVLRVVNEATAGHVQCDVFDGTTTVASLEHKNLVQSWLPDSAKELPAPFKDPNGFWVATNLYVMFPAINTDLVAAGSEPKSWDDLLDPKWRGKMAVSASNSPIGAPGFVGLLIKTRGEDAATAYLKKLAAQNVANLPGAAREVLDQVIAGEYALGINMVVNHVVASDAQGAPAKWLPIESALVVLSTVSIAKDAPHANAAKLFLDFLISAEGQAIYSEADYLPANPTVKVSDPRTVPDDKNFRSTFFSPEELDAEMPKWNTLYRQLFR
jgi:ABC-type Fe3+ transport system substrate-binding protein